MRLRLFRWLGLLVGGLSLLFGLSLGRAQAPGTDDIVADAMLERWEQPTYPASLAAAKIGGQAQVQFVVDATGAVSQAKVVAASEAAFGEAALAAVETWHFRPAEDGGKPHASGMIVTVVFDPAQLGKKPPLLPPLHLQPEPLPVKPSQPRATPDPRYPAAFRSRRVAAEVDIEFVVSEEGRAVEPLVRRVDHPGFVAEALATLRRWRFAPARQGDLAVRDRQRTVMRFEVTEVSVEGGLAREALAQYGLRATPEGTAGPGAWKREPRVVSLVDPVLPFDLAAEGAGGAAEVDFVVNRRGVPERIKVRSAARPELGEALQAAVAAWLFQPARDAENDPVEAALTLSHTFEDPRAVKDTAAARLWRERDAGGTVEGARGLDARLRPLFQFAPIYPEALRATHGEADVTLEIVIDREGGVQMVRVAEAEHPAFGYASAVAVAQWCFEPPMRGGEPVDVRVKVPFAFAAPQN